MRMRGIFFDSAAKDLEGWIKADDKVFHFTSDDFPGVRDAWRGREVEFTPDGDQARSVQLLDQSQIGRAN
jgi:hypothetical protein